MRNKKQQLESELQKIKEQERISIIKKHYPIFNKKFEGKYFKYKNCYSCPEKPSDYWWLYTKVVSIKPDDIYDTGRGVTSTCECWEFQTDKYGNISINKEKHNYVHSLGTEISEDEFNAAWNKMIENLNKLP